MAPSIQTFSETLTKLIHKFGADKGHYLSKEYPEAQARIDFITPFFKALGWDVENEAALPHGQREVIVERGETEGRPDYNFRLGGQTKFFVEAKAPSESLSDPRHILQAKGYAWNIWRWVAGAAEVFPLHGGLSRCHHLTLGVLAFSWNSSRNETATQTIGNRYSEL